MVDVTGTVGGVVTDPIDIFGNTQIPLSLSTTAAQTASLNEGVYDVYCATSDVYIKVGQSASDVTTANGYLVLQNNTIPVAVPQGARIGAIIAAGTGTLVIHKVG